MGLQVIHSSTLSTEAVAVGQVLRERYEIVMLLKSDSDGTSYRAHDRVLLREVEIRVLGLPFLVDHATGQDFRRKSRELTRLIDKGVQRVYSAGVTDCGHPYLVRELVQQNSLADSLCNSSFSMDHPLLLVDKILASVDHIHSLNLIHGSLSTDTIIIQSGQDLSVKITNVGERPLLAHMLQMTQDEIPLSLSFEHDLDSLKDIFQLLPIEKTELQFITSKNTSPADCESRSIARQLLESLRIRHSSTGISSRGRQRVSRKRLLMLLLIGSVALMVVATYALTAKRESDELKNQSKSHSVMQEFSEALTEEEGEDSRLQRLADEALKKGQKKEELALRIRACDRALKRGLRSPDPPSFLGALANCCERNSEFKLESATFERLLKWTREARALPQNKYVAGRAAEELWAYAEWRKNQGQLALALPLSQECIDMLKESKSPQHPKVLRAKAMQLGFFRAAGDHKAVEQHARQLLTELSETSDRWMLSDVPRELALSLKSQGRFSEAIPFFQQSLCHLEDADREVSIVGRQMVEVAIQANDISQLKSVIKTLSEAPNADSWSVHEPLVQASRAMESLSPSLSAAWWQQRMKADSKHITSLNKDRFDLALVMANSPDSEKQQQAIALFDRAIASPGFPLEFKIFGLIQLANLDYDHGLRDAARAHLLKSLALCTGNGDLSREKRAEAEFSCSTKLFLCGCFKESIKPMEEALKIQSQMSSSLATENVRQLHALLAKAFANTGDMKASNKHKEFVIEYMADLERRFKIDSQAGALELRRWKYELANILHDQGQFAAARDRYEELLQIPCNYQSSNDVATEFLAKESIGNELARRGDPEGARECYRSALAVGEKSKSIQTGWMLNLQRKCKVEPAQVYKELSRASKTARDGQSPRVKLRRHCFDWGLQLADGGQPADRAHAQALLTEVLKLRDQFKLPPDPQMELVAYMKLAELNVIAEHKTEAEKFFTLARNLCSSGEKGLQPQTVCGFHRSYGLFLKQEKRQEPAMREFKEELRLYEISKDKDNLYAQQTLHRYIAELAIAQDQMDEALNHYMKELEAAHNNAAITKFQFRQLTYEIADALYTHGQKDEAIKLWKELLKLDYSLKSKPDVSLQFATYGRLGPALQAQNDLKSAKTYYLAAFEFYERYSDMLEKQWYLNLKGVYDFSFPK